ncbi:MAG: pyruvate kinase [bacterium]
MKRTKIICTIGPASEKLAVLNSMIKSGMNVARLNFSHGTHASHKLLVKNIRAAAKKNKKIVGILADLQGPKIRIGDLKEPVELKTGNEVVFTTGAPAKNKLGITYSGLHKDVKVGDRILADDGLLEFKAIKIAGKDIICKIINGGKISAHKGMNFPDTKISLSSLTPKDKDDLAFAMEMKVDFVAISFVRNAGDIKYLKKLINDNAKKLKVFKPKVVAKIEKPEALENFISILAESDAIMIARGDLGVETPAEDVPLRQKEIIGLCRQRAVPVIVATQMLDSMIRNPRPTRAEVSDVANAVMANADAVMLSGESATGSYPREAVAMMNKIILETEASPYDDVDVKVDCDPKSKDGIGEAAGVLVREKNIKQIVDLSGNDLYRYVSKWRPEADILVKTDEHNLYPNIFWAVQPFSFSGNSIKAVVAYCRKKKLLKKGKAIVISEKNKIEVVK